MSLSSNYLDAFLEVAREKSFSAAAKKLNITQSALSQRVLNLEQELGSTLFIREASGTRLTDLGNRLLRYCQTKESLESEFLGDLKSVSDKSVKGILRVAGFSTLNRSVLLPLLSDFLKDHPEVQVEMKNAELRDIPAMLSSGRADFVFSTQSIERQGIGNHLLGYEEYVLVQSTAKSAREDVLLDHDKDDLTTHDFFKAQGKKIPTYRRSYLDEIYSIIDGVRLGMGRAVIPLHLAESSKGIEIVRGNKSLRVPVYLSYYTQSFYTDLQKAALQLLTTEMPKRF